MALSIEKWNSSRMATKSESLVDIEKMWTMWEMKLSFILGRVRFKVERIVTGAIW